MRNQHTRDILFLDIRIVPDPPAAPRKSMDDLTVLIGRLFNENFTARWNRPKTHKIYLRDFSVSDDGNKVWMLICSTDAEAPGASFAHLGTDEQRDLDKEDGEGRPETSHLLILRQESNAGSGQYLALFEESARFPRIEVERYLNFLIRQSAKVYSEAYLYPSPSGERTPDGAPKMISYKNTISVSGHLSNDFQKDIESGTLRGVSLQTSHKSNFGFGESKRLTPVQKQIKLNVVDSWKVHPAQIIAEALSLGKANKMEAARIVFATPDDTSHTAIVDTENGNILNDGYIKKVRLTAKDITLPEASRKFIELLQSRMLALLV